MVSPIQLNSYKLTAKCVQSGTLEACRGREGEEWRVPAFSGLTTQQGARVHKSFC